MAGDKQLPIQIVIGAVDEVTYKVMAINEKIKKLTQPARQVGAAFATLGEESGLTALGKGLGEMGKNASEVLDKLGEFGLKAGAVIGVAAAAAFEFTKNFAESGEVISVTAKRLGLTTDAYQELAYAAKMSHVDQDLFNSSMTKFSKGIAEASVGAGEAFVGFMALGIQVRDSHGKLKTLEQILPQVANKLSHIHNQNLRNAVSMKLFGRQGAQLNEMFLHGAKGIDVLREKARQLGGIMTPEQLKEAEEIGQRFKNLDFILGGIRNTIGAALGPAVEKLMDQFQSFLTSHKDSIRKFADQFAENLPGYIDQASKALSDFGRAIGPVVSAVGFLCEQFGGVNLALAALFTYCGGFGLIGSILKLAWSFKGVLGPALQVGWVLLSMLGEALLGIGTAIVGLVGWPVLLAGAFIAAAVAIWKWWGPISELFSGLWDKVKGILGMGQVNASLNVAQGAPALAPPIGTLSSTESANASVMPTKQETELRVIFDNVPRGTRVETKKADAPYDLSMGYAYPAAGH